MDPTTATRVALPLLLLAFAAVLLVWPVIRLRRRSGVWAVTLHRETAPGQRRVALAFLAVQLAAVGFVAAYAWRGPAALGVWRVPAPVGWIGLGIAAVGTALVAAAQHQMGASFRIGIDDAPTALVQGGWFGLVRNPIFTGLLVLLAGIALAAPCSWSLGLWAASFLTVSVQTRLEERHLLAQHGETYRAYASRVGRFLPRVGRLPRRSGDPGPNAVLAHYDRFAFLVDLFRDWPYREARAAAIEALQLRPGDRVVDLFCGTGVNFEPLLEKVGPTGRVVGVDGSEVMLARARRRIRRRGLAADRIELRRIDVTRGGGALREVFERAGAPPRLLITLALACFADYEAVFGAIYEMLPPGTRVVLMEGSFERRSLACRVVDWIGAADCTRRTWEPLERRLAGYQRRDFPLRFATLFVAAGTKAG